MNPCHLHRIYDRVIHIRVDTDVLEWYKSQGKGYQTKMNAVLRDYAFASMHANV
ncbi:MAG: BrnA antitoxin family protein [Treponema sp.]